MDIFPELSPVLKELETLKVPRETFIPSKNGEKVFCQLSLLSLKEDGSQLVVIFIRDLRTGQEEEIILQESEERYHSLFNNMLNGFAYCKMIFKDDKAVDFIYLDVNNAFESLTGLKNVVGKYVSEVIPGIRESDPELFEIYSRVALSGQTEVFEIFLESLQEWFSVSVYSPRREYFVAIFDVITSQKESEEMLKKSLERETFFGDIMRSASVAIGVGYPDGKMGNVNKAFEDLTGYSQKELMSIDWSTKLTPAKWQKIEQQNLEKVLRTKKPVTYEKEYVRKDGSVIPVELVVQPHFDQKGDLEYYFAFINDLTERKKAEEQLKKSEIKYRNALENMMEGCQIISHQWKYLYLNEAAVKHSRFPREKLINHTMMEIYPGIEDTDMYKTLQKSMEERVSSRLTNEFVFPDGKKQWFELSIHPVPEGIFILSMDITERKNVENELKKGEEKYRMLYSSMAEGMAFHKVIYNNQGRAVDYEILDVNPSFEALLDIKKEDIVGKKASKIYGTGEAPYLNIYAEVAETGQPEKFETYFETMQMYFRISVVSPSKGFFTTVFEDITENKNFEKVLKKSEERFKTVADFTYDWEYWMDPKGTFLYVSPSCQRISGYSPREFMADPQLMLKIAHPQDRKILEEHKHGRSARNNVEEIEFRIITKEGKDRWIDHRCQPIYNDQGEYLGIRATNRDITEVKKAQEVAIRWEEVFEKAQFGLVLVDPSTNRFLAVNPTYAQQRGYSVEELIGMEVSAVHLPGNREQLKDVFKQIDDAGHFVLETHNLRKDGSIFPVLTEVTVIKDEQGRPKSRVAYVLDTTTQKEAEKALKYSEAKYRGLFENMAAVVHFWRVIRNAKGQIVDWVLEDINPAGLESWGMIIEEVKGKSADEIFPGQGINHYMPIVKKIMAENTSYTYEDYFEALDKHFIYTSFPLGDNHFISTGIDISERIQIESELKASESRYRGLFDKSSSYLFLASTQGTIIDINEITVEFTGKTKEELIGKHISEMRILPPEEIPVQMEKASRALQGQKVEPFESSLIDKDGELHYVMVNSNTLKKDGEIIAFQIICNDITDLKLAEKEIMKSLQEKELLLQEIHHRVKNNMQIISSLLNLQSYQVQEEETRDILNDSQGRIKAMSMVHEKLYQSPDLSHINVKEYVEKLVQDLFYSYEVKGHIDFHLEIEEVEMNMETVIPVGLIINELVTNSLKFAFPDGEGSLGVSLKSKNHEHTLMVYDDGIGMDEALNIHKPGTLGLKLVQSLVDQLDAEMKWDGSAGTRFIIRFQQMEYKERI